MLRVTSAELDALRFEEGVAIGLAALAAGTRQSRRSG
jgi:hypothetical protein